MEISRRKFFQVAGVTTATLVLSGPATAKGLRYTKYAFASEGSTAAEVNTDAKGMLIDITKCVGCGMCSKACKEQNNLPGGNVDGLNDNTWTSLKTYNIEKDGETVKRHVREQCFHCLEPACASACPVGALVKTQAGPVIYDGSKCIGCRYCMIACPFSIPKYQWDSPFPLVRKCIFCFERLKQGEQPACAEACMTGATEFGARSELLKKAEERIAANPQKYIPHIYGLEEVGGTSFLYLSDVPFELLGFPTGLGKEPLPSHTWKAMSKIPGIVAGGAVFLGAAYQLNKGRREGE